MAAALASSRIWFIDINCGAAETAAVADALNAMGIAPGTPVRSVVPDEIAHRLDSIPGMGSTEAVRRGVVLRIDVGSTGEGLRNDIADETGGIPSSIYADCDCVITSVSVTCGRAMVKVGDAVKAGELLVSGDLGDLKPGYAVAAEGEVEGKLLYRASASVGRYCEELLRTGCYCDRTAVSVFGMEFGVYAPYAEYECERFAAACVSACPLPVAVYSCRCYELAETTVDMGVDGAERLASEAAAKKLLGSVPKEARILSLYTETEFRGDTVTAFSVATVLQKIGTRRELTIDGK